MQKITKHINILLISGIFAPIVFSSVGTFWIGLSVICGLLLLKGQQTASPDSKESAKSRRGIVTPIALSVLALGVRLLFSLGITDSGFSAGGFNIIPTYTLLIYPAAGICFECKSEKKFRFRYPLAFIAAALIFVLYYLHCDAQVSGRAEALGEIWSCIFVAALCEELFFRSAVYNSAAKVIGRRNACFFSAAVFTVWHFNLMAPLMYNFSSVLVINLINIFFLGIVTAVIYELGGIACCVIFHAINNGVILYILDFIRSI